MDVNDFKTFLEVVRTRHFGQAAQSLCITQSTVSARIKTLEEQLGTALFVRQRNNIQLTPAGEKLLSYAELITTTWNRARQEIATEGSKSQPLVIGGVSSLWDILSQQWLQDIYSENQHHVIYAEVQPQNTLLSRLSTGTMDLAFVYENSVSEQFASIHLIDIPLIMVSSRKQSLQDATAEKYVLVDWGSSFLTQHAEYFASLPAPEIHASEARIAFDFIKACGGSAYLAEPMVREYLQAGKLFNIEDVPVFHKSVFAVYNKSSEKRRIIESLLAKLGKS